MVIDGGTFAVNAADDAIHSNHAIVINAGVWTIATGDDAIHADQPLEVNGGSITIAESYEGLEGEAIIIDDGVIQLTARDGGVSVAGGTAGAGTGAHAGAGRDLDGHPHAGDERARSHPRHHNGRVSERGAGLGAHHL